MNLYQRAHALLDQKIFGDSGAPMYHGNWKPALPKTEQFILRMMVKAKGSEVKLPEELEWIREILNYCIWMQSSFNIPRNFIYITVRHGEVKTKTDDEWHVDGFSLREHHIPEQNYIWSDHSPTEWLDQDISLPSDFDGLKHNLHRYIQKIAKPENTRTLDAGHLYCIDPYIAHRRPQVSGHRTFFRISFVPIEIEDDTCTPNPLMEKKFYGRRDIRKNLTDY